MNANRIILKMFNKGYQDVIYFEGYNWRVVF